MGNKRDIPRKFNKRNIKCRDQWIYRNFQASLMENLVQDALYPFSGGQTGDLQKLAEI